MRQEQFEKCCYLVGEELMLELGKFPISLELDQSHLQFCVLTSHMVQQQ